VRGVGDGGEDRLRRGGNIPFVDEHVRAHEPGGPQDQARERLLHAQGRVRGVALVAEVGDEPRAGDRLGETDAVELARGTHGGDALEEGLGGAGGPDLDADLGVARPVARDLAVGRARGDLHRLARAEQVLAPVLDDLQRPRDDLVALGLLGVHMRLDEEAARPSEHVELDQLAARVRRRPHQPDPAAQRLYVQHVTRVRHLLAPPGSP
jgi:hypothetical protein